MGLLRTTRAGYGKEGSILCRHLGPCRFRFSIQATHLGDGVTGPSQTPETDRYSGPGSRLGYCRAYPGGDPLTIVNDSVLAACCPAASVAVMVTV